MFFIPAYPPHLLTSSLPCLIPSPFHSLTSHLLTPHLFIPHPLTSPSNPCTPPLFPHPLSSPSTPSPSHLLISPSFLPPHPLLTPTCPHPLTSPSHPLTPSPSHQPVSMVEDNGLVVVRCKHHLVTRFLIGDILLLVAYLWGLYIFRSKSPEHLATLMETVSFV